MILVFLLGLLFFIMGYDNCTYNIQVMRLRDPIDEHAKMHELGDTSGGSIYYVR